MGVQLKAWHVAAGAGAGAGVLSVSTALTVGTLCSAIFATIMAARTGSPKPFVYATLAAATAMAAIGLIAGAVLTIVSFLVANSD